MKKYICPHCVSTSSVIRKTKRGDSIRYYCKACNKYFSIKTIHLDRRSILSDHLDGLSFRKLGRKYRISKSQAWEICHEELERLPKNNEFTFRYCNRFSQVFIFDGKYFNVASEKYDYCLLWGIDYFRHDIPVFTIAPSENYQSWRRFFSFFRIINSYPRLMVCDDNPNLKMAARSAFPQVRIQTCYNHFKENIRRDLRVRTDPTYKAFMRRIESVIDSSRKLSDDTLNHWLWCLYRDYAQDPLCLSILTTIEKYKKELLAYRNIPQAPVTTNLIEGMNAHLESRLHSLRSFQTIEYARLWLNGYILKRRVTQFTDCRGKFKYLNCKTGLEMTKNERLTLPTLF